MRKLLYFLLFNFSIWNYGYAQVFQEDFQTVSPLYGTNVNHFQCPSISFKNRNNQNIDCLSNWRTYKGTPAIETENGNSYLSMWSQIIFDGSVDRSLNEVVYLNSYKLEPQTNYRLVYYIKANYNGRKGGASFRVDLTAGLTPYYYQNSGPCGSEMGNYFVGNVLDFYTIPENGITNWEMRTLYFSTENQSDYTLAFHPNASTKDQLTVMIDNVAIYKEGVCQSNTVSIQNKIITSKTFSTPTYVKAKRIYVGKNVIPSSTVPFGDVVVKPSGVLNLLGTSSIDLKDGLIVEEGGIFDAYVDGSCYAGNYKMLTDEKEEEEIITDDEAKDLVEAVVYPNPSNGRFTISSIQEIDEILVYNALGQEINRISSRKETLVEVEIANKLKGVYFLKIRSGNEWVDKKIIIE